MGGEDSAQALAGRKGRPAFHDLGAGGFPELNSPTYLQLLDIMSKYHIGSFAMTVRWEPPFLYRSEPYEAAELLNRLQEQSKLPAACGRRF